MTGSIAATRLAALVGEFDRSPAYAGLAQRLRLLIAGGRVDLDLRLPSERDLCRALDLSRTTVTRAYAALVDGGFAVARQGSGTFTRLPGGRRQAFDRSLTPHTGSEDLIDLSCAASAASPGLAAAYTEAVADLPLYLGGTGYFPTGLPALQQAIAETFDERGLPTTPDQILVVPGALSALMVVASGLVRPRDRALVESPGYPNGHAALRRAGARRIAVPMDVDGWDLDAVGRIVRDARPSLAYVIADFQNPTGNLMGDPQRAEYADLLRRAGTVPVVDESHQALRLDGRPMPRPFASFAPEAVTIGSVSKSMWGGLRVGWIRCPAVLTDRLVSARISMDLGSAVLEQLVAARLLRDRAGHWGAHRERLRRQRDVLAAAVTERLPGWRFRLPRGGLSLWCELPGHHRAGALDLAAEAEQRGVAVSPGPAFSLDGGLDTFVRVPFTRPEDELRLAVDRLADAWEAVTTAPAARAGRRSRVMVA
ncbi:MAG TPA: PLP-dependent aminotransferase family protein [Nocardioides sp.]|jgi:DNA-binding transcriptional MocR family regulator|uniref:MocR-like transcription factor YczR n=1 Tax=Nocardioides sp. TaxID=35761 RepID=UPI002E352D43|nr:PLP-dependent aminotransferase family protein [Nocardioides sp.]HEX3929188.1 PLP-dependent aminotransferase family protein [Nocardioides sp.]